MPSFDFDFQRYVERRRGAREAQVREGAAYAYGGDLRVLWTLARVRPVTLAVEGAVRLWRSSARAELLGPAMKTSPTRLPEVQAAAERCAERLHIALPTVYVTPAPLAGGVLAWTFGGGDDPAILLHASLAERLRGGDLDDVLGRECGHVQNDHVLYRTALYFLTHAAGRFVRWIVKPATMALEAWHKRAEVTGDRAGLLCSRELDASLRGLAAVHTNAVAPAARAEALKLFASSAYYLGIIGQTGGLTADECDARVAQVLK